MRAALIIGQRMYSSMFLILSCYTIPYSAAQYYTIQYDTIQDTDSIKYRAIPIDSFPDAILDLKDWIDDHSYVHFPIEIRFTREDDIWLSPCYKQTSCYIGIIMYRPVSMV